MTAREDFEAWAALHDSDGAHRAPSAWDGYLAGIARERAACALACEAELINDSDEPSIYDIGVKDCAAAIRSRTEKD